MVTTVITFRDGRMAVYRYSVIACRIEKSRDRLTITADGLTYSYLGVATVEVVTAPDERQP